MGDGVPIEEWTGELSYRARLSRRDVVVAKASLNRAKVRWDRPETRRSIHEQVEGEVKFVETPADDLWIGEKFQSSWEIAGSPRNSFRASVRE